MHHTTPMHQRPSYLVWIEIAGIVGLGALLLGLPAVLALEMMSGGGSGGGAIAGGGGGPSAPPATARRTRPAPTPIPGLSPGPSSGGGAFSGRASPTPFSDGWQAQAAPDLAGSGGPASPVGGGTVGDGGASNGDLPGGRAVGPSGPVGGGVVGGRGFGASPSGGPSPSVRVGGGPSGGGTSENGPALAARRPTAGTGGLGAAARSGRRSGGDRAAREEAEQLAGTMQALSGQLRQMGGAQSQGASAEQIDSDPGSPDDPDRRDPGSPSDIPIGDHLHWLVVAGVLWGAWQIGRGA